MICLDRRIPTYLLETANMRILLHNSFYSDPSVIKQILDLIPEYFDLFSLDYDAEHLIIKMKIKKTNMKKNDSEYVHTSNYYYKIVNDIMYTVISTNIRRISRLMMNTDKKIKLPTVEYILDKNNISSLYMINTILDNIVVITL